MAITFLELEYANTTSVPLTSSIGTGQLIIAHGQWYPTPSGAGFTDNVNSGSYNIIATVVDSIGVTHKVGWIKTNVTGTPTVSLSGTNGSRIQAISYNGFGTGPYFPASDTQTNTATGTAVSIAGFNASYNLEFLGAYSHAQSGTGFSSAPASPWAIYPGSTGGNNMTPWEIFGVDPTGVSAGTAVSFTGTLSGSDTWTAIVYGFYDGAGSGGGGTATIAWIT
jgi:hypothetical protein